MSADLVRKITGVLQEVSFDASAFIYALLLNRIDTEQCSWAGTENFTTRLADQI